MDNDRDVRAPEERLPEERLPKDHLIVFTRYPQAGKTKTRLIPALGAPGAARLQRQMTERTVAQAQWLQEQRPVTIEVRFFGGTRSRMRRWLGNRSTYLPQGKGDLGDRLQQAVEMAFAEGSKRVTIVGSDCPGLNTLLFVKAFDGLTDNDLVLGPASDGGYYLIGLRRSIPELFENIDWGTERVLEQTMEIARNLGLSIAELPVLDDVDRPEDLPVWEAIRQQDDTTPKISVILPVLNEADRLEKTLKPLQTAVNVETIVVDGGSTDRTRDIAKNQGCLVLSTTPGRARQMNAGAAAATGEILLFLHGDTQLPMGFEAIVRRCLLTPKTVAGAFELKIDGESFGLRTIETLVRGRSKFLQLPYGDQAIFLRTQRFGNLGGFRELPIMEDFELVRQLQNQGQIRIVPAAVLTSGRRWQKLGVWKTTIVNQCIILGYFLGISPERLARWYRKNKF
ncbi:MAG: TIGR04283 family arsenosugar biosynthesis glycosyltransferase [Geitlerinemataceae cyanobacterium]